MSLKQYSVIFFVFNYFPSPCIDSVHHIPKAFFITCSSFIFQFINNF
ncbi:Uncharacterised protein [Klebsiella variicola]|uniref:Uncharacterized protein n=1 Tax=Klebsiella variicola TaxID=244366 RepID=A0A7H4MKJ2_KLEVA|nr:Uncharacterised protein [Klebsiella variicola]